MSSKKTKLELTWIGKEHRPKLEPRILLEEPDKSYHAKFRVNEPQILTTKNTENTKDLKMNSSLCSLRSLWSNHPGDIFDNMLIRGDNLLGLKALEQEFAGKVKCVFIDPPYNTGVAFDDYEDGLEHSIWLSLIRDRLELIKRLLAPNGSLWVTLDDNEAHYLKVLGDEVFGRRNFIADIAWRKRDSPPNDRVIGSTYDHILVWSNGSLSEGAHSRQVKA